MEPKAHFCVHKTERERENIYIYIYELNKRTYSCNLGSGNDQFCCMNSNLCTLMPTGLSALQYVNLNSARNLYIIGFSIFFSLVSHLPIMNNNLQTEYQFKAALFCIKLCHLYYLS
jgi:hypothetical protein